MNNKQQGHIARGEALPKKNTAHTLHSNDIANVISELLPLHENMVGSKRIQTINARELHAFLKSGQEYSHWMKARIAEYEFIEGDDFARFDEVILNTINLSDTNETHLYRRNSAKARGRRVKGYALTLDMAKELAMVERNTEGRRARRYFIDCERRLAEVAPQQQVSAQAHWQAERDASKDYHGLMCRALLQHRTRQGKETAGHHYSNELGMINRLVLGMDGKAWLAEHGLKGEVRKHLSAYQLALVAFLERSNATFLDADMPFAERKMRLTAMLAAWVEREGGEK